MPRPLQFTTFATDRDHNRFVSRKNYAHERSKQSREAVRIGDHGSVLKAWRYRPISRVCEISSSSNVGH
jgi:hypothetical protein